MVETYLQSALIYDVFRGWGKARTGLSEAEALRLAEALPPPVFDADEHLRELDRLESEA